MSTTPRRAPGQLPHKVRFATGVHVGPRQAPLSSTGLVSKAAYLTPPNAQRSPPEGQHALPDRQPNPPLHTISRYFMPSFASKISRIGAIARISRIGAIGLVAVLLAWLLARRPTIATFRCTTAFGEIPPPPPHVPPHIAKYVEDKFSLTTVAVLARISRGLVPLRDFALAADGGEIISGLTSGSKRGQKRTTDGPQQVLNEDMRVGSCWRIPDAIGQVGISIPVTMYPTNITIDHIPKEIASDIGQAPREMVLWGVMDGNANTERYDEHFAELWPIAKVHQRSTPTLTMGQRFIPVAKFMYDIHGPLPTQTFPVHQGVLASGLDFGVFVLEVLSNWGSDATCLYRVRLHGTTS